MALFVLAGLTAVHSNKRLFSNRVGSDYKWQASQPTEGHQFPQNPPEPDWICQITTSPTPISLLNVVKWVKIATQFALGN